MYKFNKKVIQPTTVMESDNTGAALQTVKKASEGVGGLSEIKAMMKKLERVSKAEIDTVMQMMTDGKSIAETKAMLQEMTYWKWEWEEEPLIGDSDDNIKPRRLRIRDNTAKRYEEKAIREVFQRLVDTAKIVGEGAIHGISKVAYKLNADHGYQYQSYLDELDEVLRMKTTPQIHIENNFEKDSCRFEAGSSLNGDILLNQ